MSMRTYLSDGGVYEVNCPPEKVEGTRAYVHAVEAIIPALQDVWFPLVPSFDRYNVTFGKEGALYLGGGRILMKANMDFQSEEHRYGGLFHETVHGFVEKCIHRPYGTNVHPSEVLAIIMQVAALRMVNATWASKFRNGYGSNRSVHRWLGELGRVYDDVGIEPIRAIYKEMGQSPSPIFSCKDTYGRDVNCLWDASASSAGSR